MGTLLAILLKLSITLYPTGFITEPGSVIITVHIEDAANALCRVDLLGEQYSSSSEFTVDRKVYTFFRENLPAGEYEAVVTVRERNGKQTVRRSTHVVVTSRN